MKLRTVALASLLAAWCSCGFDSGADGAGGGNNGPDAGQGPDAGDESCTGGTLCGLNGDCCEAGNECVAGECLVGICDSGTRCGLDLSTCCTAGEVCIDNTCAAPGSDCLDSYDCVQPGEFCEPTLGKCLPQPATVTCEIVPTFSTLSVAEESSYTAREIISIPVVADVDADGWPEVIINTTQEAGGWEDGSILILDGRDVSVVEQEVTSVRSHGRSTIAVGDVSGDGVPDILFATRPAGGENDTVTITAVDAAGTVLWTSHDGGNSDVAFQVSNAAITVANFDADPEVELVIGAVLIDHDGLVVWTGPGAAGAGTNSNYYGGIAAVVELDGDATPEIVTGNKAWDISWTPGAMASDPPTVTGVELWASPESGDDGYPAIADLDSDGVPEVVLVGNGQARVLDGLTGSLWCGSGDTAACAASSANRTQPISLPGGTSSNRGGPPTIADFDADGRPEIGIAGGHAYVVIDANRTGEEIERFGDNIDTSMPLSGEPMPGAGSLYFRWMEATQDLSSNATGSSVFDFQGDGAAEVVYADECYARVYSGTDGSLQVEIENSSATIHEYPLVVDADADGNSEILIVANDSGDNGCPSERRGLFMYGDSNDEWVPTRRVWTQHTYHVSNSGSDGNAPLLEVDNWTQAGLNNYRQNVQGDGVFNAPDLGLDLSVGLSSCGAGELVLQARITNLGALGIPPGASVEFFEGTDAAGVSLGTSATATTLLPGESEVVNLSIATVPVSRSFFAQVDGGAAGGVIAECDETNNSAVTNQAGCPVVE